MFVVIIDDGKVFDECVLFFGECYFVELEKMVGRFFLGLMNLMVVILVLGVRWKIVSLFFCVG